MTDLEDGKKAFYEGEYKTAFRLLLQSKKEGDAEAQYLLGCMYEKGLGVPQNYDEATSWHDLSFKQDYTLAVLKVGEMLYYGLMGRTQNFEAAKNYFENVAKRGIAEAQYILGIMHEKGEGTVAHIPYAHMWYNLAAFNNHDDAKIERERLAKNMNISDIRHAQDLALMWLRDNPEGG